MPIIAKVNNDKMKIYNNEQYKIKEINEDVFYIEGEEAPNDAFDTKTFYKYFDLAFAVTVHKSQGETFHTSYCIYEWERFDDSMKYVALSRATDFENINVM